MAQNRSVRHMKTMADPLYYIEEVYGEKVRSSM